MVRSSASSRPVHGARGLCDDDAFRDKVLNVRAMAGAWDSRNNLFANQFNVGADLEAATFILGAIRSSRARRRSTRRTSARRCSL